LIALLARALGGFYLFGGLVLLRALALAQSMELVLAALGGRSRIKTMARATLLGIGAVLTCLSGLALLLLHASALPLMLANVAIQIIWLLVAARWFPPEDEDDRLGRTSTLRATALFAGVTLLTLGLERGGHLVFSSTDLAQAVLTLAAAGFVGWQIHSLLRLFRATRATNATATTGAAEDIVAEYLPARLHLEPRYFTFALWDAESGQPLDPDWVTMAPALRQRIVDFGLTTGRAFDTEQPGGSRITDPAMRAALEAEAQAIVALLIPLVGEENVSWRLPDDEDDWRSLTI